MEEVLDNERARRVASSVSHRSIEDDEPEAGPWLRGMNDLVVL
ncbi:MAG: hypothetical protein AAF355_16240 [Myxococcota bacterium]